MNQIMWTPEDKQIQISQMMTFMNFVNKRYNISLRDYNQLYNWSIEKAADFWGINRRWEWNSEYRER